MGQWEMLGVHLDMDWMEDLDLGVNDGVTGILGFTLGFRTLKT